MRFSKPTRAPDINALARHYLQRGLRNHPDAALHVANVDDIEGMPMLKLMNLAKKMGVDADSLIERTEAEEHEISRIFGVPRLQRRVRVRSLVRAPRQERHAKGEGGLRAHP